MTDIVTLKELCTELKIDPREAREKLRAAVADKKEYPELAKAHKPRSQWQWVKGAKSYIEAKKSLETSAVHENATIDSNVSSHASTKL